MLLILKFCLFVPYFFGIISSQQDEHIFEDGTQSVTCFNQIVYQGQIGRPNRTVSNCAMCELYQVRDINADEVTQEIYLCSSLSTSPLPKGELVTPDQHYIVQYCTCETDRCNCRESLESYCYHQVEFPKLPIPTKSNQISCTSQDGSSVWDNCFSCTEDQRVTVRSDCRSEENLISAVIKCLGESRTLPIKSCVHHELFYSQAKVCQPYFSVEGSNIFSCSCCWDSCHCLDWLRSTKCKVFPERNTSNRQIFQYPKHFSFLIIAFLYFKM